MRRWRPHEMLEPPEGTSPSLVYANGSPTQEMATITAPPHIRRQRSLVCRVRPPSQPPPVCPPRTRLLPNHRDLILQSAIAPAVGTARGYWASIYWEEL